MTDSKYYAELGKIRASRLNEIIHAVNCKVPKNKIGLKGEVEKRFYNGLINQANSHVKKHGFWPTFDMYEIESDDPRLDIYGGSEV